MTLPTVSRWASALTLLLSITLLLASCSLPSALLEPNRQVELAAPTPIPVPTAPREVVRPFYYPDSPVRLLLAFGRNTEADIAARILAPRLEKMLGQPVVVVNLPEEGGMEMIRQLKQAKPDGYTLGLVSSPRFQSVVIDPSREQSFSLHDLVSLGGHVQEPIAIFARSSSPYTNITDLLAAARAQPNRLAATYALDNIAGTAAALNFQRRTGQSLRMVPAANTTNALMVVLAGQADIEFGTLSDLLPSVQGNQGRILAVMSDSRLKDRPSIPTLGEAGVDAVSYSALGYVVPRGTAQEIVDYLCWAFYAGISDKSHLSQLQAAGLAANYQTPAAFKGLMLDQAEAIRPILPISR